jgi:hypothetical protein
MTNGNDENREVAILADLLAALAEHEASVPYLARQGALARLRARVYGLYAGWLRQYERHGVDDQATLRIAHDLNRALDELEALAATDRDEKLPYFIAIVPRWRRYIERRSQLPTAPFEPADYAGGWWQQFAALLSNLLPWRRQRD